jgi:hypothetical protein
VLGVVFGEVWKGWVGCLQGSLSEGMVRVLLVSSVVIVWWCSTRDAR